VDDLRAWPYSNYLEWIDERDGTLVDREFVRYYFPEDGQYARYVEDYVKALIAWPDDVEKYCID
jgi:hypothetical protein